MGAPFTAVVKWGDWSSTHTEGRNFILDPSIPHCQGPRVISRAFVSSRLFLLPGFISVSFLIPPEAPILWWFISFPFHSAVFEPPHRIWTLLVLLCFSFKAALVEASFVSRYFCWWRWCWNKWGQVCRWQRSPVQQINCEQSIRQPNSRVSFCLASFSPQAPQPLAPSQPSLSRLLSSPLSSEGISSIMETSDAHSISHLRRQSKVGPSSLPSLIKAVNSLSRYLDTNNNNKMPSSQ